MKVAIITGSGTYALPEFEDARPRRVETRFGAADVTEGRFAGVEVVHVSRHGEGHMRVSNHVDHRANIAALQELGVGAVIGCTACGAVDPEVRLGEVIVFDEPGGRARGHWIIGPPFSPGLRGALTAAATAADVDCRDGGCYGHVDGPRFNTRTEIAQLAAAGVTAVSQTGGPETVLCGEAELPYALMGFATDYANGVTEDATPVEELVRLMGESTARFAAILAQALPSLDAADIAAPGEVHRFEG
ncbi:MAG TPA: MTAP family purine nucleoside phosphorylase [Solirubrobacteraceae bacterium]